LFHLKCSSLWSADLRLAMSRHMLHLSEVMSGNISPVVCECGKRV
jgi:hypothetical protein